jgi:sugar phosphate isomerase/epimerase
VERVARSARALTWPDLVWAHFSRPRFGEFDERVAAAAVAGFAGIGLYLGEYARLREEEGRSLADIASVLDGHGLVLSDVEVIRGWWATAGPERDECRRLESAAYELADGVGARYVQVIGPYACSAEQAIEGFAALCDRAAEHGLLVGVEWLPYTNIATAADAQRLVTVADRPNGGYCLDIWHHVRGADDVAMIRALEPERIFAVQMNDGPRQPEHGADGRVLDYKADCLANRLPPGDGEFDCMAFVRLLEEMGVRAPISLEVCSTDLWQAPAAEAARRAADGMRRVLAEAGRTTSR